MRSYFFDEITAPDMDKLRAYLAENLIPSRLDDVFWLALPDDLLSPEQRDHGEKCGPHRMAVVLEEDSVRVELLVRAENAIRCACVDYADRAQRRFCMDFLDRMLEETGAAT